MLSLCFVLFLWCDEKRHKLMIKRRVWRVNWPPRLLIIIWSCVRTHRFLPGMQTHTTFVFIPPFEQQIFPSKPGVALGQFPHNRSSRGSNSDTGTTYHPVNFWNWHAGRLSSVFHISTSTVSDDNEWQQAKNQLLRVFSPQNDTIRLGFTRWNVSLWLGEEGTNPTHEMKYNYARLHLKWKHKTEYIGQVSHIWGDLSTTDHVSAGKACSIGFKTSLGPTIPIQKSGTWTFKKYTY